MYDLHYKTKIQSAQLRQLLSESNSSLIVSILIAAILAYTQQAVIATSALLVWCGLFVLASLLRAYFVLTFQRRPTDDDAQIQVRLVKFRLGVLIAGLVWGSAGFLLFPDHDSQHQLFLILMLLGMTAGGVISFSVDLFSAMAFSVSIILPVMIRLFVAGDSLSVELGIASMLYLAFMLTSVRLINRNFCANISLHLESDTREQVVRASEERYRLLLSHLPVGIFHYDTNLVITYSNQRFADILRSSTERIIGLDMKLLKDTSVLPALCKALEGETDYYEGHYFATFSEADAWIALTCAPTRDDSGKIVGGIAIVQDITERKQAEADLRIAAVSFEAPESLMITDADGVILRVNQAFTESTGYSAEEAVGQTPRLLKSDRHNAEFYHAMWASLHRTGAWQGEIWDRRKNGEIFPIWLTISAVKGVDGTVTHYVGAHLDITERKASEEKIAHLAFYDSLTRLPNRRLLLNRLQHALTSSVRSGKEGALMFIDLDNFKTLNDTLGHDIGDQLLQQVAQLLTGCLREVDTVARLGGDEFVVILEGLSKIPLEAAQHAEDVGNKILAALSKSYLLATHDVHSTTSIGVTLFNGNQQPIDELMKQADIAMYQAKQAGRDTLRFFNPKMQSGIADRAALEKELRKAIDSRQFHLHYQIQMDSSNRPMGAEALIRWPHPERGLVSPAQFIPLAEETGLILPIGQWVLETACAQIKAWQLAPLTKDLVLAVNVSAKQFRQVDFVAQVHAVLQHHAFNPKLLKLELTEGMLLENIEDTISTMNALKEMGIQFSLDDFGTGYSSLQYLKRLPLDQLKIDQSFVRDIATDNSDKAIVRTIIAMAQSLDLNVIAEGVETEEQKQLLLDRGCTHYQGYFFGKPMSIDLFEALLLQNSHLLL